MVDQSKACLLYTSRGLDTDYAALRQSLTAMMFLAAQRELSQIAIPGYLGCGLAGGDWETVYSRILIPLFSESCFTLTILYLPDSIRRLWTEFGLSLIHILRRELPIG